MRPLILLLCVLSFCLHATGQELAAAPFLGGWINQNDNTRSVTKASFKMVKGRLVTQMWGKCIPNDCDWGNASAEMLPQDEKGTAMSIIWELSFCVRFQTLRILDDGRLSIITKTHYTDKSGRADQMSDETYIRGKVPGMDDATKAAPAP